jgi:hypothetical protein
MPQNPRLTPHLDSMLSRKYADRRYVRQAGVIDAHGPDDPPSDYPEGLSLMEVSADADWRGTGHVGVVETYRPFTLEGGYQTFVDLEDGTNYMSYWTGSEWSEPTPSGP